LNRHDFVLILLVSFSVALFSFTLSYSKAGLYIIYCIAIVLFILLFLRKFSFVYYVVLIITLNMSEYSKYISTENFYTFRTVKLFGISFASIFIVLLVIYKLLFSKKIFNSFTNPLFRIGLFILSEAICLGIVYLAFGDSVLKGFENDLIYFMILFGSFYLAYDLSDTELMQEILLIALLIAPINILFGWAFLPLGSYGGAPISSFDSLYYAIPLIPSFFLIFKKRTQSKIPLWLVAISSVCSIVTIILQASGKSLIFLTLGIIIAWLTSIKRYSIKRYALTGVIILLIVLVSISVLPNKIMSYGNTLLKSKSYEVYSLFEVIPNILNNPEVAYMIEPSARVRALEFMNIFKELEEFPINLLIGKGIGGSFTDKYYRIPFTLATYSEDQWVSRIFYMPHETLNFVLLKFGILGIIFLLFFVVWLLRKLYSEVSNERVFLNIVLIFGILFMLGYSLKLAIFIGTVIGLLSSRHKKIPGEGGSK